VNEWTPERTAALLEWLAEAETPGADRSDWYSLLEEATRDIPDLLAELDRVREERDGLRARILGLATELETAPCSREYRSSFAGAERIRGLL